MMMRREYSCHLACIHTCNAVHTPHAAIHAGTHNAIPTRRPTAALMGCSATKNPKKRATAVFRSPLASPMSEVKWAVSALPIYRRSV